MITDEQIRVLLKWGQSADECAVAWFALYGNPRNGRRERARAECERILRKAAS